MTSKESIEHIANSVDIEDAYVVVSDKLDTILMEEVSVLEMAARLPQVMLMRRFLKEMEYVDKNIN